MWLLLLACPRSISPALELEPPVATVAAEVPEPAAPEALLAWILAGDPLARRTRVPGGTPPDPLGLWATIARSAAPTPETWWALEHRFPGTIAVPLARGGRLASLETHLADVEAALDDTIPLPRAPTPPDSAARTPLAWLDTGTTDTLLAVLERAVLLGWLDGPDIDARAAGELLAQDRWARLANTLAGALLRARAEGRRDRDRAAAGAADLALATSLMIEFVAADSVTERTAVQAEQARVLATLGAATGNPVTLLLARALPALTADAAEDSSAGLALVAQSALRWLESCGAEPCGGLDQVATIHAARRWGAVPTAIAAVWEVATFKDARDHLDAAYDRATFPLAVTEIADVLVGLDPLAPLDRSLLARTRPDPSVHLAVARAADARDATDAKGMFEALDARLKREIGAARPLADARQAAALDRMLRRLGR